MSLRLPRAWYRTAWGLACREPLGAFGPLGSTWTALIIVQVALAVAALPVAIYNAEGALRLGRLQPSAAADQLLNARLLTSRDLGRGADSRYTERMTALVQRLPKQPEVACQRELRKCFTPRGARKQDPHGLRGERAPEIRLPPR